MKNGVRVEGGGEGGDEGKREGQRDDSAVAAVSVAPEEKPRGGLALFGRFPIFKQRNDVGHAADSDSSAPNLVEEVNYLPVWGWEKRGVFIC